MKRPALPGRAGLRPAASSQPPAFAGVAAQQAIPDAATADSGDPVTVLRHRVAETLADSDDRSWSVPHPRVRGPRNWLVDDPLVFGALLVAVLVLGLAIGARLFRASDSRTTVAPPAAVVTDDAAPGGVVSPVRPPAQVRPVAPGAIVTAPAAAVPDAQTAAASAPQPRPASVATLAAPVATVPPPANAGAAGATLPGIVGNAARQSAPAAIPPPAAGFPVSGAAAGTGTGTGAVAVATRSVPLNELLQNAAAQAQLASTAAAERSQRPVLAPARAAPAQPTPQP